MTNQTVTEYTLAIREDYRKLDKKGKSQPRGPPSTDDPDTQQLPIVEQGQAVFKDHQNHRNGPRKG